MVVQEVAVLGLAVSGSGILTMESPPVARGLMLGSFLEHFFCFLGSEELVFEFLGILARIGEFVGGKAFFFAGFPEDSGIFGNDAAAFASGPEGTVGLCEVHWKEDRLGKLGLAFFDLGVHASFRTELCQLEF